MHFEAMSMDTLMAAKELKKIKINPYYFILHTAIDNADSGHTAIAGEVVCEYMEYIKMAEGQEAAEMAWKRIQSGYLLSSGLPGTTVCPSRRKAPVEKSIDLSAMEENVVKIFQAKAKVGHKIHCSSRRRIGSRKLVKWLDPIPLQSKQWQKELLYALSSSEYWICRGDSSKSRFMDELSWGGKMFGSFTNEECDVVKRWIDEMPARSANPYRDQEHSSPEDVRSEYPVLVPSSRLAIYNLPLYPEFLLLSFQDLSSLRIESSPSGERLLPLWFSHPFLLHGFTSVPFRTSNKFGSAVIKVLRAQRGFDIQRNCVAGIDEYRRIGGMSLQDIGMQMRRQYGLAEFSSVKDVLDALPSDFATQMLHMSMRPVALKGLLIGMATVFAKLHKMMAESTHFGSLGAGQASLINISQRELLELEFCWRELEGESDRKHFMQCCHGSMIALREIQKCFGDNGGVIICKKENMSRQTEEGGELKR